MHRAAAARCALSPSDLARDLTPAGPAARAAGRKPHGFSPLPRELGPGFQKSADLLSQMIENQ